MIDWSSDYGRVVDAVLGGLIGREALSLSGNLAMAFAWCCTYVEEDQDGTLSPWEAARKAFHFYILSR